MTVSFESENILVYIQFSNAFMALTYIILTCTLIPEGPPPEALNYVELLPKEPIEKLKKVYVVSYYLCIQCSDKI